MLEQLIHYHVELDFCALVLTFLALFRVQLDIFVQQARVNLCRVWLAAMRTQQAMLYALIAHTDSCAHAPKL